jgi:hypothetical protein
VPQYPDIPKPESQCPRCKFKSPYLLPPSILLPPPWTMSSEDNVSAISVSGVNLMPFSIQYDGAAPVSSYLVLDQSNPQAIATHFRGRKIIRKTIPLPDNVIGLHVVTSTRDTGSTKKAEIHSAFGEVHLWQHDIQPTGQELDQCLDWFELSDAVSYLYLYIPMDINISFFFSSTRKD